MVEKVRDELRQTDKIKIQKGKKKGTGQKGSHSSVWKQAFLMAGVQRQKKRKVRKAK